MTKADEATIRMRFEKQSELDAVELQRRVGVMAELAEPTRPLSDPPYQVQPFALVMIAIICVGAGFVIGAVVQATMFSRVVMG